MSERSGDPPKASVRRRGLSFITLEHPLRFHPFGARRSPPPRSTHRLPRTAPAVVSHLPIPQRSFAIFSGVLGGLWKGAVAGPTSLVSAQGGFWRGSDHAFEPLRRHSNARTEGEDASQATCGVQVAAVAHPKVLRNPRVGGTEGCYSRPRFETLFHETDARVGVGNYGCSMAIRFPLRTKDGGSIARV
eukprot:scaffold281_cov318-Pavlova_lutheri.AAC.47